MDYLGKGWLPWMEGRGKWEWVIKQRKGQKKTTLKKTPSTSVQLCWGGGVGGEAKMVNQQTVFTHLRKILHMFMCQEINIEYN